MAKAEPKVTRGISAGAVPTRTTNKKPAGKVDKDVATPCEAYLGMAHEWRMISALLGGTRAMRDAGTEYLPQYPAEDKTAYDFRLKWTYLYNYYKKSIKALVGKPFARPLSEPENITPELEVIASDFDLQGNDITICMKKWFECAMSFGLSHGLIDYPNTGGQYMSLADEREQNVRPYFVHVPAKDVIGWKTVSIGGVHHLSQVRIKQSVSVADGQYGESYKDIIRVLNWIPENPVGMQVVWELHEKTDKGDWMLTDTGFMSACEEIPFVTLYTGQTGFMTAEPPLLDMAYINVAHWQSNSDYRHLAHLLSVPILFGKGWQKDNTPKAVQIGPDRMLTSPSEGADLKYVEHSGKGVEFLQNYMQKMEDEMAAMAIKLLAERQPGGITATEIAVDSASAESALKSMVTSLQDAIEMVVYFMQVWMNQAPKDDDIPQFKVNTDFGLMQGNDFIANWLLKANAQGIVQKKTVLEGAKSLGYVKEDLDVNKELEAADEESVKAFENMNAALGENSVPGAPGEEDEDTTEGGQDSLNGDQ